MDAGLLVLVLEEVPFSKASEPSRSLSSLETVESTWFDSTWLPLLDDSSISSPTGSVASGAAASGSIASVLLEGSSGLESSTWAALSVVTATGSSSVAMAGCSATSGGATAAALAGVASLSSFLLLFCFDFPRKNYAQGHKLTNFRAINQLNPFITFQNCYLCSFLTCPRCYGACLRGLEQKCLC